MPYYNHLLLVESSRLFKFNPKRSFTQPKDFRVLGPLPSRAFSPSCQAAGEKARKTSGSNIFPLFSYVRKILEPNEYDIKPKIYKLVLQRYYT
jgi:hypothetical protein